MIVFISAMEGAPWGGSEELWCQAAARLVQQGNAVTANVKEWAEPAKQVLALQSGGCEIEWRRPYSRLKRIAKRLGVGRKDWLDRIRPNLVVISGDHLSSQHWAQQCRNRNIPYVLIVQAAYEYWWPEDEQALEVAANYEEAAGAFFVSEGNRNLMRVQLATPLKNAKVISNPFNVSYDAAPTWPQETESFHLACVGRLEPLHKGQDIIFDVLRGEKWQERPIHVTLFGDGRNRQSLQRLKQMYALENVTFGGFSTDVEEIWRRHHALILPSRYEGLPLALVEAMLCGRLVITTDVAGNAELLEEGVTGFIAQAPTKGCLDDAMERAWDSRARWQQMGQAAGIRVRQKVPRDPAGVFADLLLSMAR